MQIAFQVESLRWRVGALQRQWVKVPCRISSILGESIRKQHEATTASAWSYLALKSLKRVGLTDFVILDLASCNSQQSQVSCLFQR